VALAGLLWVAASTAASSTDTVSTARDGWRFDVSATELAALCDSTLEKAQATFDAIEKDTAPATLPHVYGAYDAMNIELQSIQHIWYMKAVHPDPLVQTGAETCINAYSDFIVSVNLSPQFYRRVAAIDLHEASAPERLMVEKKLIDFRRAGVDRNPTIRARVRTLMNEISELGNAFEKNIRMDKREIETTRAQLDGLPQDFLDLHPADERGIITISTDYPDYFPVMQYGADDDLRHRLFKTAKNIATPTNARILKDLIARRHDLATLLGYESHAALAMDGLMVGSPQTVEQFLSQVGAAVRAPAGKDMAALLVRLRQINPQAQQVQAWQIAWLSNLVQQENYSLDAREIRNYFHFDQVQAGIFELTEDLFGVRILPWRTPTWHPDVTAWEIREQGQPIGRFYLDMHPREHKYGHAAHWTLRTGLKDRQLPLSGMATNFPRGLMEHTQVETFLHEFGHLLHNMFSGTQQWLDISGMSMEMDFVEAPSQMLEEWVWDYDTLRRFAVNEKGQAISRDLVAKMNAARHFGEAAGTAGQVFYAKLSLNYYSRDPKSFQLLPLLVQLQERYSPFPYVADTHFYNNFRHLNGYSSNYYTYQWSRAISTDLFTRFQRSGLRNAATARAYREKVLAPAGSKPARLLVQDFLGRPFTPTSYTRYLNQLD
jgi:thimet oligopeptidase